jgi:hypothetical protein
MRLCTVLIAWEMILLCHAPGRDNGAGALCRCSAFYFPTPTLSACRSSHACSSLTGISLRRPRRTSGTSGSICARQVSQDTPSASHACSTLSARAGALRFWAARMAAIRGDIGAICGYRPRPARTGQRIRYRRNAFVRQGSQPIAFGCRLNGLASTRASPASDRASHWSAPPVLGVVLLPACAALQAARSPHSTKAQTDNMHGRAVAQRALCELAFGVLSSLVLAGALVRAVGAVVGVAAGCARCWLLGAVRWHAVA